MPVEGRAGRFVTQLEGYAAFEPSPLPPEPPLDMSGLLKLQSDADQALGRLDGIIGILPNPDLFVGMYVRQEAVLSSQIEGTQASLTDVLKFEAGDDARDRLLDVGEVVNYVHAMNYGLKRLSELPLCMRLIREIHGELMKGVRGKDATPGEFRRSQNWIGPAGSTLRNASFIPPHPSRLGEVLGGLEKFLHDEKLPSLIVAALAHAHFETIHPFLDGNGRMGRLLITFLLCERKILSRPVLYLSVFLKQNRSEYYDRLQRVRTSGDWEQWVEFFLRAVVDVATRATTTARSIISLQEETRTKLSDQGKAAANLLRTAQLLFEKPIVTPQFVADALGVTYATANNLVSKLLELGVLRETTGYRRNRQFAFDPYLRLFTKLDPADGDARADGAVVA
jgi:Fic family protein